jgi:anti-anti-sigma regulatory factor
MDEQFRQELIMSDETDNDVTEDKSNLIGVDPLAWLSEEEKASLLSKVKDSGNKEENIVTEVRADEESASYIIKFDSAITIRDISELMEELSNIDSAKTKIVFDCSQVEKTDAAALQLITGFYLFSRDDGKNIVWEKPSNAFYEAVTLLGLNDILNLPSVAA